MLQESGRGAISTASSNSSKTEQSTIHRVNITLFFFKWQAQMMHHTNSHIHTNKKFQGRRAICCFYFSFDPMISWANIFLHFDNHNEWFHFLFSLQYFLKEMENIFSLVLQSYKLKYSSKFGWTRKSCPKIPLVFHQLSRSIENVDFFFHFLAIYCQWSENIFRIDHYSFEESWDIFLRKIFFQASVHTRTFQFVRYG